MTMLLPPGFSDLPKYRELYRMFGPILKRTSARIATAARRAVSEGTTVADDMSDPWDVLQVLGYPEKDAFEIVRADLDKPYGIHNIKYGYPSKYNTPKLRGRPSRFMIIDNRPGNGDAPISIRAAAAICGMSGREQTFTGRLRNRTNAAQNESEMGYRGVFKLTDLIEICRIFDEADKVKALAENDDYYSRTMR